MRNRVIGYLTDHHLSLSHYRDGRFTPIGEFDEGMEREEVARLLSREAPVHLLTDVIEMDFRQESVARLRGGDRRALHNRKLAQTFRDTPFRHVMPLGFDPADKKSERLVLSAVTNPDLVRPWLQVLRDHRIPLSGITALPYLLTPPARTLWRLQAHFLLVTHQTHAGLRLSYFREGDLLFSRLAQVAEAQDNLAAAAREEVVRTQQYLASLRLLERDRPLTILCVTPAAELAHWQRELFSTPLLEYECVTLPELAKAFKLPTPAEAARFETLALGLLAQARFPNHLADSDQRHDFHIHLLRRGLNVATAGLALSTALDIGYTAWVAADQHAQADTLEAERQSLEQRYQDLRAGFPETPVAADEIKGTVDLAKQLAQDATPSRRLLSRLSLAFDSVPDARLDHLTWLKSPSPEQVEQIELPAEDAATPAGAPTPTDTEGKWVAVVEGNIVGTREPRAALASFERLRSALGGDGIRVDVLQTPVDTRPESRLTGAAEPSDQTLQFIFRLRVTWLT